MYGRVAFMASMESRSQRGLVFYMLKTLLNALGIPRVAYSSRGNSLRRVQAVLKIRLVCWASAQDLRFELSDLASNFNGHYCDSSRLSFGQIDRPVWTGDSSTIRYLTRCM